MKRWLIVCAGLLATFGIVAWVIAPAVKRFFYPPAPPMPPAISTAMPELLSELEHVIRIKAPAVADSLQPGLSDEQISRLEAQGGFHLPDDVKALYRWHNGSKTMADGRISDFTPGKYFVPLQEAVAERAGLGASNVANRLAFLIFASYRSSWIHMFNDRAGDGYFYDPDRGASQGAVFEHFAEGGYYEFFPATGNLVSAILQCYEQDAYRVNKSDPLALDIDVGAASKIWQRFGTSTE